MTPGGSTRVGLSMAHPVHGPAGPRRYASALADALRELKHVEVIELPPPAPGKLRRRTWDVLGVSLAAQRRSVDVLHCTGIYPPLVSQVPVVLTVHDLAIRRLPHAFPRLNRRFGWGTWSRLARRADCFIAVSEATRKDLIAGVGVPPDRVSVVHHGVGGPFGVATAREVQRIKATHRLAHAYVLAVGTVEPRKNLPRTLEAFLAARPFGDDGRLVVVGAAGWGQPDLQRKLRCGGFGPSVQYLGQVSDVDLAALYTGAQALVFPSLHEGFGLPALEAMACGCPVITSGRGGLAEVVGDAALRVDPHSVADIVGAMRALAADPTLSEELRRRGRERAAGFTWRRAAEETRRVYRQALGISRRVGMD